ncbi:K(+)-transporting ATPase subunit F [Clostridium estertheticum]|nr:K(+)-transporting ATPase subunit F [Clostridium estertheticum]
MVGLIIIIILLVLYLFYALFNPEKF